MRSYKEKDFVLMHLMLSLISDNYFTIANPLFLYARGCDRILSRYQPFWFFIYRGGRKIQISITMKYDSLNSAGRCKIGWFNGLWSPNQHTQSLLKLELLHHFDKIVRTTPVHSWQLGWVCFSCGLARLHCTSRWHMLAVLCFDFVLDMKIT